MSILGKITPSRMLVTISIGTVLASVNGVWHYLNQETNSVLMASAGALAIGAATFVAWDNGFNQKNRARMVIAIAIAIALSSVSIATLYQYNLQNTALSKTQALATQSLTEKANVDRHNANIQNQIDSQQSTKASLIKQNEADLGQITALTQSTDKNRTWQIAQVRKAVEARNTDIAKADKAIALLGTQLKDTPPVAPPVIANTEKLGIFIRASMYDVIIALFLLFAAWYRKDRDDQDMRVVANLKDWVERAETVAEQLKGQLNQWAGVTERVQSFQSVLDRANDQSLLAAQLVSDLGSEAAKAHQSRQLLQQVLDKAGFVNEQIAPVIEQAAALNQDAKNSSALLNEQVLIAQQADRTLQVLIAQAQNCAMGAGLTIGLAKTSEELLERLKLKIISPNESGLITTELLESESTLGRRGIEPLREKAFEMGYLNRRKSSKGYVYFYPESVQCPVEVVQSTNVISIKKAGGEL